MDYICNVKPIFLNMCVSEKTSNFIEKAKKVHGDKYDYSNVVYVNNKVKVCIICPEHGEFWQTPHKHLKGQGCQKCGMISKAEKHVLGKDRFIEKSRGIHGDKYDYSRVEYVNNKTKVCIICPEHGEFWQTPKNHLNGQGCPKCSGHVKSNTEEFITKAKCVHSNKYDYCKTEYVDNKTKVCIICPEHGEFWQTPQEHLQGKSCPICGVERMRQLKTKSTIDFINESKKIHKDSYIYDKVEYKDSFTKVIINCPKHGDFEQLPYVHLQGFGCSKCSQKYNYTTNEFIQKAKEIQGDKYDYSKVKYINSHTKVTIICPIHGEFEQRPYEHLQHRGCPKCSHLVSNAEQQIGQFINECGFEYVKDKKILNGLELDIYISDKKLAIEYDGLIWHSEKFGKDRNYHLSKTNECEKQGIRLIHIFEDEWLEHKEIVKSKIRHLLGCDKDLAKVYARSTYVKEIDNETAKLFLNVNHIQGYARSTVYVGCYYTNELVAVMSFRREQNNGDKWELTRFASDINKHCVGVGGKLFKYFVEKYKPSGVKSFADRRWTSLISSTLYDNLGFNIDNLLKPDYHYVIRGKRVHKFNLRKPRLLKKYGEMLTNDMTEHEMTEKLGFWRIYDCGLIKYKWST